MKPDYAVPPGTYLKEYLDDGDLNRYDLTRGLGLDDDKIDCLLSGEIEIDEPMAGALEELTGAPQSSWLRLEEFYRSELARIEQETEEKQLVIDLHAAKLDKYLRDMGLINATMRNPAAMRHEFLDLHNCEDLREFELTSEQLLRTGTERVAALKVGAKYELDDLRVMTWLEVGHRLHQKNSPHFPDYDVAALESVIPSLRVACRYPNDTLPIRVSQILAKAGVGFVCVPPPPKLSLFGMTRWLQTGNPLIQLTGMYRDAGHFTHALFHELGHVLDHPNRDFYDSPKTQNREERVANKFAYQTLLGPNGLTALDGVRTQDQVVAKAQELSVAPGLIVMYLRRRKQIRHSELHSLCIKLPKPDIRDLLG